MQTFSIFLLALLAISTFAAPAESESSEEVAEQKDGDVLSSDRVDVVKPWKKFDYPAKRLVPDFLKTVSAEAKEEFNAIHEDQNTKKSAKQQKLRDWAEKYDLESDMEKFIEKREEKHAECKENRKTNYKRLGEVIEQADKVLSNDDLTWNEVKNQLAELIKEEERSVQFAFRAFFPFVGHEGHGRHGHGLHGHHGKRNPRNIGHGAHPKHSQPHHQIGYGIEPVAHHRNHEGGSNRNYDPYGNRHHNGRGYL